MCSYKILLWFILYINDLYFRSDTSETPSTEKLSRKSVSQVRPDPVRGPVPVNTHLMSQVSPDVPDHSSNSDDISKNSEAKSKKYGTIFRSLP